MPRAAKPKQKGQIAVELLFLSAVVVSLITGFVSLAASLLQISVRSQNKLEAFTIAEAGIEYYRWHLAHATQDFQDGTGGPGPYVHNYYDKDGNQIGQFSLAITPPPTGSTIVTITSAGTVLADTSVKKVIAVRLGIPSFAKYAVAANDTMRFGSGTIVYGQIVSNGGIRFDGVAHNLIASALTTYNDPDHSGADEWAVHTHVAPVDPLPPSALPTRADVFMAGRVVSVPAIDFASITQNLSDIKASAQSSGVYASSSGVFGYDLVLATSSKFTLYKVTALNATGGGCTNSQNQSGWGSWSIQTESLVTSGTFPGNGLFFIEDNLWVRGQIQNARLTIASGKFPDNPATRTSITVNTNLLYTYKDGTDSIGLIAQNNINVGERSDNVFEIDAALVAQNGRAGRYYYGGGCSPYNVRSTLTSYGMIATNQRYGFAYSDGTGYQTRNLIYDANLLYGPPPSFPLTTDAYSLISWQEVQ